MLGQQFRNRSWSAIGFAIAAGSIVAALASPATAQQTCAASIDVDLHYCFDDTAIDPAFTPSCDPLDIQDLDTVTITVQIQNTSDVQPPPVPANPDASGHLQTGKQVKVFYACSDSVCMGTQLANWFTFNSVDFALPGISFVDDGNGFSGTITFTGDIPFAGLEEKTVLRINLTAHKPPAIGGNTVFARANSDLDAFLIDDAQCLAGITGGGQGSTAGLIGPDIPMNGLHHCWHANQSVIKFDRSGSLDYLFSRAAFDLPAYDPATCDFTYELTNANGTVVSFTLPPGSLQKAGQCYIYQDKNADETSGVQRLQICPFLQDGPDGWCFNLKGWDDFSANATLADMPITVSTCGNSFTKAPALWKPKTKGWLLPLKVWKP